MSKSSLIKLSILMSLALIIGAFSDLYVAWFVYVCVAMTTAFISSRNTVSPVFRLYIIVCSLFALTRTLESFSLFENLTSLLEAVSYIFLFYVVSRVVRLRVKHLETESVLEILGLFTVSALLVVVSFSFSSLSYSSQLWAVMTPVIIFIVAIASALGRATDPVSKLLILSTLGPLVTVIAGFEKPSSYALCVSAFAYVALSAALGLRKPIQPAKAKLRREFGKLQLAALLMLMLLPSAIFLRAIITSSSFEFAVAAIIIGTIGSILIALRIAFLIKDRDWTYEQEKNLTSLSEKLVNSESKEDIFTEIASTLQQIVGKDSVSGIAQKVDTDLISIQEDGHTKKIRSTIHTPVPGEGNYVLYGNSAKRFRPEANELFGKAANQMFLVLDRQTTREESLRSLRYQANHDQLTGLYNRSAFMKEANTRIQEQKHFVSEPAAFLFIDIDGFKTVNDTYGHDVGDNLLKKIASCLLENTRDQDLISRIGGDEFFVMLTEGNTEKTVMRITTKIQQAINELRHIDSFEISISSSIGISYAQDSRSLEEVMKQADTAMYQAKRQGGNKNLVYQ